MINDHVESDIAVTDLETIFNLPSPSSPLLSVQSDMLPYMALSCLADGVCPLSVR